MACRERRVQGAPLDAADHRGLGDSVLLSLSLRVSARAPAMAAIRRRVRSGRRGRPISRATALVIVYAALIDPGRARLALLRRCRLALGSRDGALPSVDLLFTGAPLPGARPRHRARAGAGNGAAWCCAIAPRRRSASSSARRAARCTMLDRRGAARAVAGRAARARLRAADDRAWIPAIDAAHPAARPPPQWRAEVYARDVNSALAGYVRAQTAAGLIVGVWCVAGFALIGVPSAVSLGVSAGVLELVPALGPMTAVSRRRHPGRRQAAAGDRASRLAADRPGLPDLSAVDPPRHASVDSGGHPD